MQPLIDFIQKINNAATRLQDSAFQRKPPPVSEFGYPYATFNRRMIASIIDSFVIFLIIVPISSILTPMVIGDIYFDGGAFMSELQNAVLPEERLAAYQRHLVDTGFMRYWGVNTFFQSIGIVIYCLWFWQRFSATPGKMLTNCVILDASTGQRMTLGQSVNRLLGCVVSIAGLTIGILWIAVDKRKQGWHDKIASTIVVVNRKTEPATNAVSDVSSAPPPEE